MAVIRFKGLEEYELKLSRLEKMTEELAGRAIYAGAGIVADEIRKGIESLPVVRGYGTDSDPLPGGVTSSQKKGLQEGLGITPLEDKDGFYNVKIGFDGYNQTRTKEHPQGQPNQLVARGVESGTSWKQKHPFVRPAVTRSKPIAEKKMQEVLDYEMKKIMD
ncbi:MAG: hypothetical protein KH420_06710 [Clostridiales bacterium]|nr:hypothetical protein [Clostridiales bacterium]DAH88890.1 MAG TPA: hypothetical protein [Caudoviricetes sp.]